MPLRGEGHSSGVDDTNLYFTSLAELDEWAQTLSEKRNGVLAYQPRSIIDADPIAGARGSLLLCHDYKGGYTEKPCALSYTFNFWHYCDSFIYFSHHRVTIPPAGWITAAHRQGVKMMGTLIFEGTDEADCLRLLVGLLPQSVSGPARTSAPHLPISPHYARLLAQLAYQKGFDGYLLNFECPLRGGLEQTRALCAWIVLLESELKQLIGDHARVIWYDSVIIDGRLRWQDRLNSFNLPFFLPASGFFTNYTWRPDYPLTTAEYFLSLDPGLLNKPRTKSLKDIYVGVDVWGRGQHGGGGLASYKALEHIDPESLGLSVALFGHAWTWESLEGSADFTWAKWWAHERTFWVGPEDSQTAVVVPDPPANQIVDEHGPFRPIHAFFPTRSPPDPADLTFFTSFCPGVGFSWFVGARRVFEAEKGWTDLDKTSSLGNMLWPSPTLAWEQVVGLEEHLPQAKTSLDMGDAWIGGNSLKLSFHIADSQTQTEDILFRCLWIPIQSLSLTPGKQYTATLVYKTPPESSGIQLDVGLSIKSLSSVHRDIQISSLDSKHAALLGGWTTLSISVCIPVEDPAFPVACGIILGIFMEDPTLSIDFDLHLGSLAVYVPSPASPSLSSRPKIMWADYKKDSRTVRSPISISGTLTWGRGEYFGPITSISIVGPEDPSPAWPLGTPCPSFLHFNIYALAHTATALDPSDAIFIGTTGLDGRQDQFYVDPACLPTSVTEATSCRFYVQGITDRGEIIPWEDCVFIDVQR